MAAALPVFFLPVSYAVSGKKKPAPGPVRAPNTNLLLVQAELLVEAADTSASIHHLLLASKEGVTLGADFHLNVLLSRTSLDHVATGASNSGLLIVGMDAFLHGIHLFLSKISPGAQ